MRSARRRVVVVASEELGADSRSGYQERALGVISALSESFDVTTLFPSHSAPNSGNDSRLVALSGWAPRSLPRQVASLAFARGAFHQRNAWSGSVRLDLASTLDDLDPDVVVWLGAYTFFAAGGARLPRRWLDVVQFDDIERQRQTSLLRAGPNKVRVRAISDLAAALVWEPRVARKVDLCIALTEIDARQLRRWTDQVVVVSNGITRRPYSPSPSDLRVITMAVWRYSANALGLQRFVSQDWPRIRAQFPDAILDVLGNGAGDALGESDSALRARGINTHGFVVDPAQHFARSTVSLAPAVSGGGSQLKIGHSIAYGRVTVGPEHLSRELDDERRAFVLPTADLSGAICELARDQEKRHRLEEAAVQYAESHSWAQQTRALCNWIAALDGADRADSV